jgi:2,3-bisphosphoglycerate-independent phosphoglycerate mutase
MNKSLLLIIMDGWGEREEAEGNAVKLARTPNFDRLRNENPFTYVNASGEFVGLPDGQMGNSEVGHLNLGAGRVVFQDFVRISNAIKDGSFFDNHCLIEAMDQVKEGNSLHLIGLVSDGGVHSHLTHLHALVDMAKQRGLRNVAVHAILDGRDTPPESGLSYLRRLTEHLTTTGLGRVATVMGRYYPMDRDKRWDRVQRGFEAMTDGIGQTASDYLKAIEASYQNNVADEFVEPIVVVDRNGSPLHKIENGDVIIFFNFRADRARQLTRALMDPEFSEFERKKNPDVRLVTMTEYDKEFPLPQAFPPKRMANILAEISAKAGKQNLRIAETEKYAHVTYFFNGGVEQPFEGENRILIPSPKVQTYDQQPEMSAYEVASTLLAELKANHYDFVVCNFANPDMVGHSGILEAAIKAVETVDTCVGQVVGSIDLSKYAVLITADHGNAEQMFNAETNGRHTFHTNNLVPCILIDDSYNGSLISNGSLRDFAPTICNYMGIPIPPEMTGRDLRSS